MKHPSDYISDLWERIWYREETLFQNQNLSVLLIIHRLSRKRTVAVVLAKLSGNHQAIFNAYEVEDVGMEPFAELLRILDKTDDRIAVSHPTAGELIVWLWKQGVSAPVETWEQV